MMVKVAQRVFSSPLKAFRGQLSFQDVHLRLQLRESVAELRYLPGVFRSERSKAHMQKKNNKNSKLNLLGETDTT